jgi:serine/threonine protein kinase
MHSANRREAAPSVVACSPFPMLPMSSPRAPSGDRIADRFLLERVASAGGMGTVLRDIELSTGQAVAHEVIRGDTKPDFERFAAEAALLCQLRHPGIVRLGSSARVWRGRLR